jgi:hypothetical protein
LIQRFDTNKKKAKTATPIYYIHVHISTLMAS